MAEHRIEQTGALLDESGRLREPGYATHQVFEYSRSHIKAPTWRIKEWDYYLINDDHFAVALTFSDLGYVGMVSASVLDFDAKTYKSTSELLIAPMGRMKLPASSSKGDIMWSNKRCTVEFVHKNNARRLSFSMRNFDGSDELEVDVVLSKEPQDSMVIATPWAEDPQAFYYNQKIVGMRAQGGFRKGSLIHEFDGSSALGLLDWGRGVWTYDNTWYWAVAQGFCGDKLIGLNLGYGFGDTIAASENMLFVDGISHKLGRCDLGLLRTVGGGFRYMEPWHMSEQDGRVDLIFTPQIDRSDDINVLNIVHTEQHQVFGTLDGRVVLDNGEVLEIAGLRCAAERVHNKY